MSTSTPSHSNCPNIVIVPTVSLSGGQQASPAKQKCPSTAVSSHPPVKLQKGIATAIYNKVPSHPYPSVQPSVPCVYSAPVKSMSKTVEYQPHYSNSKYQSTPSVIDPILQIPVPNTKCIPMVSNTVDHQSHYPATLHYHHTPPILLTPTSYHTTCFPPLNAISNNKTYETAPHHVPMHNNNCLSQNFNSSTQSNWAPDYRQPVYCANNNIYWGYGNDQHWTYTDNCNQGIAIANQSAFVPNELPHSDIINPIYSSIPEGIHYAQTNEPVYPIVDLTESQEPDVDQTRPKVPAVDLKEPSVLIVPEALSARRAEGLNSLRTCDTQNTLKTTDPSNIDKVVIGSPLQKITLANGKIIPCKRLEDTATVNDKQIADEIDKKINSLNTVSETSVTTNQFNQETTTVDEVVAFESTKKSNDQISDNTTNMFKECFNKVKRVVESQEKMALALTKRASTDCRQENESGDQFIEETIKSFADTKTKKKNLAETTVHDSLNINDNKRVTRNIEERVDEFIDKTKKAIEENKQRLCSMKKYTTIKQPKKAIEENKVKTCSMKKYTTTKEPKELPNKNEIAVMANTGLTKPQMKNEHSYKRVKPKSQTTNMKFMPSKQIERLKLQLESVESEINKRKRQLEIKEQLIQNEMETIKLKSKLIGSDDKDTVEKMASQVIKIHREPVTVANDLNVKQYKEILSSLGNKTTSNKPECDTSKISKPAPQLKSVVNFPQKPSVLKDNKPPKHRLIYNTEDLRNILINKSVRVTSNNNGNTSTDLNIKYINNTEKYEHDELQIKIDNNDRCVDANDITRKVTVQNKRKRESDEDNVSNMPKKRKRFKLIIKVVQEDSQSDIENDSDIKKTDNENRDGILTDLSFLDDIDVDEIADYLNVHNMQLGEEEMNTSNTKSETIDHHTIETSSNVCETESISSNSDFFNQTNKSHREDTMISPMYEVGHNHFQKECPEDYVIKHNHFREKDSSPHMVTPSNIEAQVMVEPRVDDYKDSVSVPTSTKPCSEERLLEKMELDIENDKEDEEIAGENMNLGVENDKEEEILDKFAMKYASSETINILGDQETIFPDESSEDCFSGHITSESPKDILESNLITGTGVKAEMEDDNINNIDMPMTVIGQNSEGSFSGHITSEPPKHILETNLTSTGVKAEMKDEIINNIDVPTTGIIDPQSVVIKSEEKENIAHGIDTTLKDNFVPRTNNNTAIKTLESQAEHNESVIKEKCNIQNLNIPCSNENYERCEVKAETRENDAEINTSSLAEQQETIANLVQSNNNTDGKSATTKSTKTSMEIPKQTENLVYNNSGIENITKSCNNLENNKTSIQHPAPKLTIKCKDISKLSNINTHTKSTTINSTKSSMEIPKQTENNNSKIENTKKRCNNLENNKASIQNPAPKLTKKCKDISKLSNINTDTKSTTIKSTTTSMEIPKQTKNLVDNESKIENTKICNNLDNNKASIQNPVPKLTKCEDISKLTNINTVTKSTTMKFTKTSMEIPKQTENNNSKIENTKKRCNNLENNKASIQNPAPKLTKKCKDISKLSNINTDTKSTTIKSTTTSMEIPKQTKNLVDNESKIENTKICNNLDNNKASIQNPVPKLTTKCEDISKLTNINTVTKSTTMKFTKTSMEIPKLTKNLVDNDSKIENTTKTCNNLENNKALIQNPATKLTAKCKNISKLHYAKVILTPNPAKSEAAEAEYEKLITIAAKSLSLQITKCIGVTHTISSTVHRGTFSTIYKCTDISGNTSVVKVLNKGTYKKNKEKHNMLTEMQTGVPKDKLFMVFLMKGLWFDSCFCYLMDYYPKNLEQALREASKPFHIDLIQELARQLVSAVVLLRNHKLVHSDIKPTHILMTANNAKLKLCGFDEAYEMATTTTATNIANTGTVQYRPPEVILGHTYSRGYNIDVWATALVLHEMATRSRLIHGTTNNEVLYQQMCLFGAAPESVLQQCELKDVHYNGDIFIRRGNELNEPQFPKEQLHFPKSTRLNASLYQAYYKYYSKSKSPDQKAADITSIRKFCKLLTEMLIIDPLNRMTIEFVFANPFIYK